jgi:lactose/L-arabinose transport system substrate-binding protein
LKSKGEEMSKNIAFKMLWLVIVAAMLLAACGPTAPEATEAAATDAVATEAVAATEEAAATEEPMMELSGELIFWGHDQHPIDLAAEGFVKLYPDVAWSSPHPADWPAKLQAALAANESCPDLVWLEASQVNDLARAGALLDITEYVEPVVDDYHPAKVAEATFEGKFYGWPGNVSLGGWYYRADLLEEAGYGDIDFETWTWDDFYAMSTDLASQGKYTFAFPGKAWGPFFLYVLHQTGGSPTDETGAEITLNTPEGILAMEIVKKAYESGGGMDIEWWSPAYWASLQDGTLVGDFAADWAKGFWEGQIKEESQGAGQWRIAPFPGGDGIQYRTGVWGGATLAIPSCAKNVDNALAMMKYAFGTVEGSDLVSTWGIIPSYRGYLESPEFTAQRSPLFGEWAHNEFWATQEPELSPTFFRRASYDPINGAIGQILPKIMTGEVSVEEGLQMIEDLAQPDVDRIFQQ